MVIKLKKRRLEIKKNTEIFQTKLKHNDLKKKEEQKELCLVQEKGQINTKTRRIIAIR